MRTPLLLLQAEADYRCPIEQGEQLYTALLAQGVPCEMVRFPGESHGQLSAGKPETRVARRQVTLEWFKRYL
jgi:dipeptidyl aminopeptidase/acylaminoacyl peptidase